MKRLLALFLIALVAVLAITSALPDLLAHRLPIKTVAAASLAIAAPSYTINEWCALRKYSRAEFYRMQFRGDGPDTIGKGRMRRITPGADAKWLKAQERKAKAEQTKAA
jgi:hypothetical protein